ncbi:uncharacterized protein LOC144875110 [Branchiostoma floridae x Branchiostoma japonicum]
MPSSRPSKEKDTDDMEKFPPTATLLRHTCTLVMMKLMSAHLAPLLTLLITFLTFFPAATQDDIGFDSGKSSPGHQELPLTVHRTLVIMGILTVCIILACACFGVCYRRRIRAQERAHEEALNAPPPSYYDVVTEPVEIVDETGASPTHPVDSSSPGGPTVSQDFVYTTTQLQSSQQVITPLSVQALLRGVRMSRLVAQDSAERQRQDRRQQNEQYADDDFEDPPPTYDTYMNYSITPTKISDG